MNLAPELLADLAEHSINDFKRHATTVADTFRQIADEIERELRRCETPQPIRDEARYGVTATQILHSISWGLANSNWDYLAEKGALADVYRAVAESLLSDEDQADGT